MDKTLSVIKTQIELLETALGDLRKKFEAADANAVQDQLIIATLIVQKAAQLEMLLKLYQRLGGI